MVVLQHLGRWAPGREGHVFSVEGIVQAARRIREGIAVIQDPDSHRLGVAVGGQLASTNDSDGCFPLIGYLPPTYPEWLGDRGFSETHGLRFNYVAGAMANGIATPAMVEAMAEIGALGFFGAAGLDVDEIGSAIDSLRASLDPKGLAWGSNLIHSPHEPELEMAVVDLYLRHDVRRVSASAYMGLTPAVVRYALSGLEVRGSSVTRKNHVFAKISRPEVARRFLEPAPSEMIENLVASGMLSRQEAELGARVPVAENITVEADSGGHTDRQVLAALFPTVLRLKEEIVRRQDYSRPVFVGAAGGLGNPQAVSAAFALGAAYVLTGSINQACIESGLGPEARALLQHIGTGDVAMAPAADMFELGAEVQVLARGTMFPVRARRLYEMYRMHESLDELSSKDRQWLEQDIFGRSIEDEWTSTAEYWRERDPGELDKAVHDPHFKMALVFRAYLGRSSRWAIAGDPERRMDFQIWCGPAMAAFNAWTDGSYLDTAENRSVAEVALNLMEGAAVANRAQQMRSLGLPVPVAAFQPQPQQRQRGVVN